jgi:hypothetical protein
MNHRIKFLAAGSLVTILVAGLFAQQAQQPADQAVPTVMVNPPPPPTRMEQFDSQKGIVITKGYTEIGTLSGEDGGSLRILVVQLTDTSSGNSVYGVALEIAGAQRSCVSYIDDDELPKVIAALDVLGKLDHTQTTMRNIDAHYRSRGDFEMLNVDDNGGRLLSVRGTQVIVPSGQVTWASTGFRLARVDELHQQFAAAKDLLDKVKGQTK